MSKFNINFHVTWMDVIKHILRIALAVAAIWAFRQYFPQRLIPKDFVFTIAVYMLIYILVSLIVESIFKSIGKK